MRLRFPPLRSVIINKRIDAMHYNRMSEKYFSLEEWCDLDWFCCTICCKTDESHITKIAAWNALTYLSFPFTPPRCFNRINHSEYRLIMWNNFTLGESTPMPKVLVQIIVSLLVLRHYSKFVSFSSLDNEEWYMDNRTGGIV